jgi:hypothetical protein
MSQLTPEVSKLLEQALSLSIEEQEVLANSLISSFGSEVDEIPAEARCREGLGSGDQAPRR